MRLYAGHYFSSNSNHIFKAFKAEIYSGLVSIELNILVVYITKSKLEKVKNAIFRTLQQYRLFISL